MLLENKTAVIYGGAGAVGSVVARTFAREGAHVFLAGRTKDTLAKVANGIKKEGGAADFAVVDAFDQDSIERFQSDVVASTDSLDISFNLIGLEDEQGVPLTEMTSSAYTLPIVNAVTTQFLTGTAAAREMNIRHSGVILALTAQVGRVAASNAGGFGVACAAIEGFCRQLASEAGPQGVRVVCLRSAGSPDAPGVDEVFHQHAEKGGISREAFERELAERTLLKRLPRLSEVAEAAVLMASDKASAVTGAVMNVTCGEVTD